MKEEELLQWIDGQIEGCSQQLGDLFKTAQQMPLEGLYVLVHDGCIRDVAVLKDLKRVVINWYQMGKAGRK